MACAIAVQKLRVPVAHVQGGIRSGDWRMPEETNGRVTDSIAHWVFTASEIANANPRTAAVGDERIFIVGNTMIDTPLMNPPRRRRPPLWAAYALRPGGHFIMSLRRPANVDDPAAFARLPSAVCNGVRGLPTVVPVHPRTAKTLQGLTERWPGLLAAAPQPCLESNHLVQHAKGVITDSGGVTEEPTVMGVPCMTLRDATERPETVTLGSTEPIGADPAALKPALDRMFGGQWKRGSIPEKWDGHTGERIAQQLDRLLAG